MHTPVTVRGVSKRFGSLTALSEAAIALNSGRVAAIVGENGAGKSTLAKIIAGILSRDSGEILVDGKAVGSWSRAQAIDAGIGFVPQSLSFVPTMSVLDNHLLSGKGLALDRRKAVDSLEKAAAEMGVSVDFHVPVEQLSLAGRQMGEIVAALAAGARILLLDEPTSALGPVEVDRLIGTIRRLAAGGTAIGLVTHRVAEVMEGADDITVMRAGKVVLEDRTAGLDADSVAKLMVGERDRSKPVLAQPGDRERLTISNLTVRDEDQVLLRNVSIAVREGEIVAVAGVTGTSQPALAEAVAGLRPASEGTVSIDGTDVTGDPAAAAANGLSYVPEDQNLGVVANLTLAENASLFSLSERGFRRFMMRVPKNEDAFGEEIVRRFDVRPPDVRALAGGLSGGNRQKLLVGRELARRPSVMVVHGPTQGLDLAAAATIRSALAKAAADGSAVLVISADLDELLELSHRMIVLTNGRIAAEFDLSVPVDMEAVGQAMMGLKFMENA